MPFEQPAPDLAKIIAALDASGTRRGDARPHARQHEDGRDRAGSRAARPRGLDTVGARELTADDSRRRGGAQQIPRPIAFSTSEAVPWPADSVWTMDSLVAAVSADVAPVLPLFPGSRLSAVLVLLAPGAEGPEVLLTRRSMNLTQPPRRDQFPRRACRSGRVTSRGRPPRGVRGGRTRPGAAAGDR